MSRQKWSLFADPALCYFKPTAGMIYKSPQDLSVRKTFFRNVTPKLIRMDGEFLNNFCRLLRTLRLEATSSRKEDHEELKNRRDDIIATLMNNMIHASSTVADKVKGKGIYQTGYFASGSAVTITYYSFPIPHISKIQGGMIQFEINKTRTGESIYQRRIFLLSYDDQEVTAEERKHYSTCADQERVNQTATMSIEDAIAEYIFEITVYNGNQTAA